MSNNVKAALTFIALALCGFIGYLEQERMFVADGVRNEWYGLSMTGLWWLLCIYIIWGFLPSKD